MRLTSQATPYQSKRGHGEETHGIGAGLQDRSMDKCSATSGFSLTVAIAHDVSESTSSKRGWGNRSEHNAFPNGVT